MAGSLLILALGLAQAACDDLDQQLEWAADEILEVNPDAARSALDRAEDSLDCGRPASPEQLARLFLLDGATAAMAGDPAERDHAFAAAARIEPDTWLPRLGPQLESAWREAAKQDPEGGEIDVRAEGWEVRLDGRAARFPTRIPAGLHVVQIVDGDEVGYGRVIEVIAGELQTLQPDLPERRAAPAAVEPAPAEPSPSAPPTGSLIVGVGAIAAFGEALEGTRGGEAVAEPGVKLTIPIEVGVVLRSSSLWIRPTLGLAPLIGGRFLFATDDGAGASGFALLGDLGAGATVGTVDVGGSLGIAYPGRISARALAALPLGDSPLLAEARAGVNLGTAGRVEPAVGLALCARLP